MKFLSFLFSKTRDNETQVEHDNSDTYGNSEGDTPEGRGNSTPKKNNTLDINFSDVSMIEGSEEARFSSSDTTNSSTRVFPPTPRRERLSSMTDEGYNTGSSNERYRPDTPYPKSVRFEKQPKFYSPRDSTGDATDAMESGESLCGSSNDERDRRYSRQTFESHKPTKGQSKGYMPDIEEDYFIGNKDSLRQHRTSLYNYSDHTGKTSTNISSKFSPPSFVYIPDDYFKTNTISELPEYMKEEDNMEPNPFFSQSFSSMTRRRKEKEPAKYDGRTDLTDYLCHFGKIATRNGWAYTDCGLELATSLIGDARSVLSDLPKAKEDDYLTLVETLMQRFDPEGRESKYSSEFLERCCGPKEDLNEYGHQLRRLARKAYPGLIVPDKIMIDVFIKGLPEEDMIKHVSLAQPQTLEEAIQIAIRCDTFKKRRKQLQEASQYIPNTPH